MQNYALKTFLGSRIGDIIEYIDNTAFKEIDFDYIRTVVISYISVYRLPPVGEAVQ